MSLTQSIVFLSLFALVACGSDDSGGEHGSGGHANSAGATSYGHGGTTSYGDGGRTNSGGTTAAAAGGLTSSSAPDCDVCARAQGCCIALGMVQFADLDPCYTFTTNCDLFKGDTHDAIVRSCTTYLFEQMDNGLSACAPR